jgi:hypothetical protein
MNEFFTLIYETNINITLNFKNIDSNNEMDPNFGFQRNDSIYHSWICIKIDSN